MTKVAKLYKIVMVEESQRSAVTNNHPEGQMYKNLHIEEIDKELLQLPGFEQSKVLSERVPYKVPVFADDNKYLFDKAKENDIIKGNIITKRIKPYYVSVKGTLQKYPDTHVLKGEPVIATTIKYFVFDGEDEDSIFRRMVARLKRVPEGELSKYAGYLAITPEKGETVKVEDGGVSILSEEKAPVVPPTPAGAPAT